MIQLSRQDQYDIFENAISWIVVFGMLIYGASKGVQFSNDALPDKLVSEMTGMELMWSFYGYSKPFVLIVGALEIIGGLLILFKKTRLIGCFFTSPILINIILQDYFYGVHWGALKAALIYQGILLLIIWLNRHQVVAGIKQVLLNSTTKISGVLILKLGIAFVLFVIFRIGEYWMTIVW
ncbi:MAG: hypothetical protein AAF960_18610 [Bacteroidota bacterium]